MHRWRLRNLRRCCLRRIADELSGEIAKRNLEGLARFHRQRGSLGFHSAAESVADLARTYGLTNVEVLRFPADGKIYYGTQLSRQAWDASRAQLSEIKGETSVTLASFAAQPWERGPTKRTTWRRGMGAAVKRASPAGG